MALGQDGNSKNSPSVKPFDASNSFVKKIANRVTGLIGWRSNSYENAEDLNHEDLPNTSLTDDETISPNPKRIKLLHNAETHNYPMKPVTKDGCNISQSINDSNVAGPSFKSKCLVASTPAVNYCVESSPQHPGNVTDYFDSSVPSNISSPLPSCSTHQRHNITIPGVHHHKDMSTVTTYDFNKSLNETSTMMSKRRPSFNAEVFSASNKRLSLSVCESRNRSCLSPFYSARTMYGGASALLPYSSQSGAKLRAESTSNLNVFSPRNQITIQPVPSPHRGGANDQETMSAAARRILDTLERYCSPIKDAKRIPMNESSTRCEDDRTFTSRGIKRKLPSLTQITPSTTDLLRIKRQEKMQDSILNARQVVSTVPEPSTSAVADLDSSSDSTDLDYTIFNDDTRRKSDVNQVTKRKEESKYDDRPVAAANVSKSSPNAVVNLANLSKHEITESFTFSKPLSVENFDKITDDEVETKSSASTPSTSGNVTGAGRATQNLSGNEQRPSLKAASSSSPVVRTSSTEEFKSFISSSSSSSRSTFGGNETSSASKTNQQLSSKSNVLNNTATNKYFSPVGKLGGKWTCKTCMLENNGSKCSSCSSQRPEPDDKSSSNSAIDSIDKPVSFGSVSSKNSNNFNKLVVNNVLAGSGFGAFNDLNRNKSISGGDNAFNATNTGTKGDGSTDSCAPSVSGGDSLKKNDTITSSASNQSLPNDPWKNLQKSAPTDQWSCNDCLVKNKMTDAKCVCCGGPNPQAPANDKGKTTEISKPSYTFGMPAVSTEAGSGTIKFGLSTTSVANTKPTPIITFGFGNNAAAASTPATSSAPTVQFSFGTTAAVTNADANALPSYSFGIQKADNSTMSFGSSGAFASDMNKIVNDKVSASNEKASENSSFNDSASVTNNKKSPNPFLKYGSDALESVESGTTNSSKTNLVQKSIMTGTSSQVVRENGDDSESSNSIFNDVGSAVMNSPMKKKPLTGGFPLSASLFGAKDGAASSAATPVQSITTTNAFGSSNGNVLNNNDFKLQSSSSTLTNNNVSAAVTSAATSQTGNLFASATFSSSAASLGNSKSSDTMGSSSFGSSAGNATVGSPFGSMNSTPFANQPLMFGNTTLCKKEKNDLSTGTDNKAGSMFPMVKNNVNNVFGGSGASTQLSSGSTNSTFGNFNSIGGNMVDTDAGKAATTAEATLTTPSLNFNSAITPSASPFRFGAALNSSATTTTSLPNNNQSGTGGFAFNGPTKLDNSMMPPPPTPKFGAFGATSSASNATSTTFGSMIAGQTPNFNFGSTTAAASPTDNSNAASFSSVLKSSPQDTILKPAAAPSFGATVFGGEAIKKSGGFNFNAGNAMSTPSMGAFSGFASSIGDNQDQNRLNNSNAPASTPFVFGGGSTNTAAPAHNFNTTIPQSFNFNSTPTPNSIPTFSATLPPANALSTQLPQRKIKKAVRRTNK